MRRPAVAFLLSVLAALTACTAPQSGEQLTIGANPPGTHAYAIAAGMAKILQESGGMRTTIRPFSGSSVYIPLLQRGEISLGMNTSTDSYLSYNGLAPYTSPADDLRLLMLSFPLYIQYMVSGDSDIHSIGDLRGRRVVIDLRANAALGQLHRGILATAGLTEDDVQAITVAGLPDGARLLTEGRADAVPMGLDTALALQADSTMPSGIRFITMGPDEAKLPEVMPGSKVETVNPDFSSAGIEAPIRVSRIDDYLTTGAHLSEDEAYMIVKTIHEHWAELRQQYRPLKSVGADAVAPTDNSIPYHPGAIRYYREAGLWSKQKEARQAELLAE
jgi:TRAP transporter TAXI family solute receptor